VFGIGNRVAGDTMSDEINREIYLERLNRANNHRLHTPSHSTCEEHEVENGATRPKKFWWLGIVAVVGYMAYIFIKGL